MIKEGQVSIDSGSKKPKKTESQIIRRKIREREQLKYRKENLRLDHLESVSNSDSLHDQDVVDAIT